MVNCHLGGCRIGLAKTVNVSEWTGSCALSRVHNIVLIEYGCLNHPFRFVGMFSVTVVVENSSIRKGREVRLLACFERERLSERPPSQPILRRCKRIHLTLCRSLSVIWTLYMALIRFPSLSLHLCIEHSFVLPMRWIFCGRGVSLCSTCQDPLASAGGGWSLFLLGGAGSLLLRRRARRVSGIFLFSFSFWVLWWV